MPELTKVSLNSELAELEFEFEKMIMTNTITMTVPNSVINKSCFILLHIPDT